MEKKLEEYNQKRDFNKTKEPQGAIKKGGKSLKYAMQHHIARREHYDLRLEWNGVLLSWAVPKGPSFCPQDKRLAIHVEDHPLEYRNFEGTIPKGEYGGGTVMLWDEGTYKPVGDFEAGLKKGSLKFELAGARLKGKWALAKTQSKDNKANDQWLLIKEKDELAKDDAGILSFVTSIKSGRTMVEIEQGLSPKRKGAAAKNPFKKADAMLAKLQEEMPSGKEWVYELKYDGYRILAFIEDGKVRLMTRNNNGYTKHFKDTADTLADFAGARAMVLDGEVVIIGADGQTDFQALQNYLRSKTKETIIYIVFDLLALDGEDLRNLSLLTRKEKLKQLLKDAPKNIVYSEHTEDAGKDSLQTVCNENFEGLVGKRKNSVYSGKRSGDWIKLKCQNRQEFIVGGYTQTGKKVSGISAVLLGYYEGKDLIYAGRAGTGFNRQLADDLENKFKQIQTKFSPFKKMPKKSGDESIIFIRPHYIAEIQFSEWTADNLLRHPSFLGLRGDKKATEVIKEKPPKKENNKKSVNVRTDNDDVIIEGITISNPHRKIFKNSDITKAEIAEYYQKAAKRMLPYVKNRILSIVRCPKGTHEPCFYKKHPLENNQSVITVPIKNNEGEEKDYFYVTDISGIISEVQMNTLEFHIWGSKADSLDKPDIMVFDLDPDEGKDLADVRQGVKDLKGILDELSLISFLKTSGGKGYHIAVPFEPSADWESFKNFAKNVAEYMEQKWPNRYTTNIRKPARKGKIFIDYIRNTKGATSVAPYSVRAKDGAGVSMPIAWSELNKIAPNGITMAKAIKKIASTDPWADFFKVGQKQRLGKF